MPTPPTTPSRPADPLRIAVLAPPWIPIPAPGYGGIETVVEQLCAEFVAAGHDVTLFAAPGSRSPATVRSVLAAPHERSIGAALYEVDHAACALEAIDDAALDGMPFDVISDHSGFAALAMADRAGTPMVHTLHGAFTADTAAFYRRHGHRATLVAISAAQARTAPLGVGVGAVVGNPITVADWPLVTRKQGYLLWLGRMDPVKGPHRAIAAAREAGLPLVLAGPVQPGQEAFFAAEVEPHLDGDRVRYVGEVGGAPKARLIAEAQALLMPIRWCEPFGMVMTEALACGTPVVAFPEGAAAELVVDGRNGFLVDDEHDMAAAARLAGELDPLTCRLSAEERFAAPRVAAAYLRVLRAVGRRRAPAHGRRQPAGAGLLAIAD